MAYNVAGIKQKKDNRLTLLFIIFIMIMLLVTKAGLFQNKEKFRYTRGLNHKILVLDAGHGGADPGTQYGRLKEQEINMAVVRKLEKELRDNKVDVILTRDGDQGIVEDKTMSLAELDKNLQQRKALAADESASIFVSVHVNSSLSTQPSGAIIYYQNTSSYHYQLAISIQNELNKLYGKKWSPKEANFVVVRNTEMPAVLVEIGFITNPKDRKFISTTKGQELIAKGIFQGIKNYTEELKQK